MSFEGIARAELRGQDGATNVWLTPRWLLDALGPFDLDPAACSEWVTARETFTEDQDGLYRDWTGLVWLNPPYGVNTEKWVQRWVQHPDGFLLVAARPDTLWFHDASKAANLCLFPRGRIKFEPLHGTSGTPAFASVLFARGNECVKRLKKLNGLFWKHMPDKTVTSQTQNGEYVIEKD